MSNSFGHSLTDSIFSDMMKGENFKDNVHAENYIFKRDLELLINIYDGAEKLANSNAKETRQEIDKINHKYMTERKTALTEEEQKGHEDFIHFAFHFNYLTLHSLFLSAYSFLEDHLLTVSRQLENYSFSRIKINDMSKDKSDLDRIRKYLNLVHNLETAKADNTNWQSIFKFQKIRNLIVHNGNRFKEDKYKEILTTFLKQYKAHLPRDYSFKISDRQFLIDFTRVASTYSDDLINEIYKMDIHSA